MESSPRWALEDLLLDIYWTLAHRLKGLGWNLNDFWEADTWTTSKFYCLELELMKKESNNKPKPEDENNPQVEKVYGAMFGYEE